MKRRLIYLACVLALIACGLVWRRPGLGLPPLAAKYGGSMLWGAMVFFCVAVLAPRAKVAHIALTAAAIAALVEFSQLLHFAPLDRFRGTAFGALLLGRTFSWWDIASYWIAIAVAALITTLLCRGREPQTRL